MPSLPRPSPLVPTTGLLLVIGGLLLAAAVGGAAPGQPPSVPPGVERPAAGLAADVDRPVPIGTGASHEVDGDTLPGSSGRIAYPPGYSDDAATNRSRSAGSDAGTALAPAQVDRPTPADPTPYGIETMYGSPDVVATAGGRGVDVAILDSGVDRDHPDLAGQVEVCRDYTGPRVREDGCSDLDGHGTHVAGTIAASGGENGTGIYGVAPEADIWAFKVCSNGGDCNSDDVADAIGDAAAEGVEVIVLSIGGEQTPAVRRALTTAENRGALLVAAAGNAGPDLETLEHPASDPAVVAVGAIERTTPDEIRPEAYRVPDFSSRGVNDSAFKRQAGYLEVIAPGNAVVSTWTGGGYRALSGTSVAVPHVAGVAARLWESTDDRNENGRVNDDVRRALGGRATTFDITRGRHARRGYDPAAGLGLPRTVTPRATIRTDPIIPTVDERVTFIGERVGTGQTAIETYRWDFDGDGELDASGPRVETTFPFAGTRTVHLRTTDADGVVSETTATVRVNAPPQADYVYDPEVPLTGQEVRFTAIGSGDPDGRIQTYAWDFDEDGGADATGATATARFDGIGPHPVTLTVFDDVGAERAITREVLVNDRPVIDVPETVRATPDQPVTLRAGVSDAVGAVSVTWYFPSGRTAVGREVTGTFSLGRHPIRVVATDQYGATAEAVVTVAVAPSTPQPISETAAATPTTQPTPTPPLDGFTALMAGLSFALALALAIAMARIEQRHP